MRRAERRQVASKDSIMGTCSAGRAWRSRHSGMLIVPELAICPQFLSDLTVAQLGESLPGIHRTRGGSIPTTAQTDVVVHTGTLSTQRVGGGG